MKILIAFLLLTSVCFAEQVQSARGIVEINDGDIYRGNSFWTGTIKNLDNVTFVGTNFSRKTPHSEVFINCTNLTFIDCNLNNVELQSDFKHKGSLTIHQREYEMLGIKYKELEDGHGKTKVYELIEEEIDIIERDYSTFNDEQKELIRQKYQEQELPITITEKRTELKTIKETTSEKRIKGTKISPNSLKLEHLKPIRIR